jgi:hypothetical protein
MKAANQGPNATAKNKYVVPRTEIPCSEAAEILRAADQLLNAEDRAQIAAGIEEARRRMNNERLY